VTVQVGKIGWCTLLQEALGWSVTDVMISYRRPRDNARAAAVFNLVEVPGSGLVRVWDEAMSRDEYVVANVAQFEDSCAELRRRFVAGVDVMEWCK
jgi:hypothetical protein